MVWHLRKLTWRLPELIGWVGRRWLSLALTAVLVTGGVVVGPLLLPHLEALRDAPEYPASKAAPLATAIATQITSEKDRLSLEKDLLAYETDNRIKIWTTIVQAIGGSVLLLGVWFTWQNLRATQAKLDIDREGQVTNRFTQAVAQLGTELQEGRPNLEVRLGGIYALERIAHDSPRDYWTITQLLTAYVRQNAPWPPASNVEATGTARRARLRARRKTGTDRPKEPNRRPRIDIQAILTVLGRRTRDRRVREPASLYLGHSDLRGAELSRANLEGASFAEANLEGASFAGANLKGAWLLGANLKRAHLNEANLEGAFLMNAKLERANLPGANLQGANLIAANLEGAWLVGANFNGATLLGVKLHGANLKGVRGIPRDLRESASEAGSEAVPPPIEAADKVAFVDDEPEDSPGSQGTRP